MIRVYTPSRLHFGLLNCGIADLRHGRLFGGAGLMVREPGLCLTVRPAVAWSAEGPLADRTLAFARRFAETLPPNVLGSQHLVVERGSPEHVGLGTGTQLAMAVGCALAEAAGLQLDGVELARRVGRGGRSALGVHGFMQGGFLVDGGKRAPDSVALLIARAEFPDTWRVVLVLPSGGRGRHGTEESEAFQRLREQGANHLITEALCRLLVLGMLPALKERDLDTFGEALHEYNARSGELFAAVQGGIYANQRVAELVAFLRREGMRGVGQSSWGPAVFGFTADADAAAALAGHLVSRQRLDPTEVVCTTAMNQGARWEWVE